MVPVSKWSDTTPYCTHDKGLPLTTIHREGGTANFYKDQVVTHAICVVSNHGIAAPCNRPGVSYNYQPVSRLNHRREGRITYTHTHTPLWQSAKHCDQFVTAGTAGKDNLAMNFHVKLEFPDWILSSSGTQTRPDHQPISLVTFPPADSLIFRAVQVVSPKIYLVNIILITGNIAHGTRHATHWVVIALGTSSI